MRIAITFVACALIWGSTFIALRAPQPRALPASAATATE